MPMATIAQNAYDLVNGQAAKCWGQMLREALKNKKVKLVVFRH